MKLHAYPKLIATLGGLAVASMLGLSAQAFDDSAAAMKQGNSAAALADGIQSSSPAKRQKNLNNLLGNDNRATDRGGVSRLLVCGDSEPDAGEQCDDGNLVDGDGCDSSCMVENTFNCTAAIAGSSNENVLGDGSFELNDGSWTIGGWAAGRCDSGCSGGTNFASEGEFWIWVGGVGDTANTGTADQTVVFPAGATTMTFDVLSAASACGDSTISVSIDGVTEWSYEDQGQGECQTAGPFNYESVTVDITAYADGGSHDVQLLGDYVPVGDGSNANWFLDNFSLNVPAVPPIPPVPSECVQAVCGDGIFGGEEACDDGNATDGDGCSSTCQIEGVDFVCTDPLYNVFDFLPTGAAPTADAIIEGSLEDGRGRISNAWTETVVPDGDEFPDLAPICSEVFCSFISFNISSDGIFYALFGASADPSDTSISQTVTIPVGANTLNFDFFVAAPAELTPCDSANDFLEVTVDDVQVFNYACDVFVDDYTTQSADISAFADGGEHEVVIRGVTVSTNGENTNFFVDNISIPLPTAADPVANASQCFQRDDACGTIETFDAGIPAGWTVINLGPDPADGWGSTGDGTCLAENADVLVAAFGTDNLTTGTGGAACADSDATGQVDTDTTGTPLEMESILCSPALDLSTVTGPSFSFNTYYASAGNEFNDNGTPEDFSDDFDEDLLEVLIGTQAPNALTIGNYTRLGGVNDHEDGDLVLTGAQELSANLEGSALEGQAEGYVCFRYVGTFAWFAQIDNAGLRGEDCATAPIDTDLDGVFDSTDNCTTVANPNQVDSNGDGIGNFCDADINNNCIVNFLDIAQFPPKFNSSVGDANYDADFDLDSSGAINFLDYIRFTGSFGMVPGPSANECVIGLGN